jgi:hypothetical protein
MLLCAVAHDSPNHTTPHHRCSDKSAVVRSRALADLAEVVDCFAALLAQDPSSEQHQVAEAFVEGLGAAAALQVGVSVCAGPD